MRTPKFSSITTTSPLAINRLFTKISTGSPASLSNSIIDPLESSSISFTERLVRPAQLLLAMEYQAAYLNCVLLTV